VKPIINKSKLGFMQGRLVSLYQNQIQFFPHKDWDREFKIAKKINVKLIEWTINYENIGMNPLYNGNIKKLMVLKKRLGVKIPSVTCDFFMQKPFFKKENLKKLDVYLNDLIKVILNSKKLNIRYIILPLVDNSKIKHISEENLLIKKIKQKIIPILKKQTLLFEIDYEPKKIIKFIKKFKSSKVGINYDTGNSASMDYNFKDEIKYFSTNFLLIISSST